MRYSLLHTPGFDPTPIDRALEPDGVERASVARGASLPEPDRPTVLVLTADDADTFAAHELVSFIDGGGAIVAVTDGDPPIDAEHLTACVTPGTPPRHLLIALRSAFRDAAARRDNQLLRTEAGRRTAELQELVRVGIALSTERDYTQLQTMVLDQARRLTQSDAGSLYLVETPEDGPPHLRFKLAQNQSRPDIPLREFTIPINHASIAGYVASTGEPLMLDDAYDLPDDVEYAINRSIDDKYGYRTKSMLTLPMRNHRDEVIGVLQLINRKRHLEAPLRDPNDVEREVTTYDEATIDLVTAMAGQAAVSIENSQLYEDIERLFEGFVTAAVTAIEQRDPTTFGHSGRVADMTEAIAKITDNISSGPYRDLSFSRDQLREIRYAALLHDFGKVGVREQVLVKSKKLYAPDLALLKQRYGFIRRTTEREFFRRRAEYLEQHGHQGYDAFLAEVNADHEQTLRRLDRFLALVLESNEPTVLPEGNFDELIRYAHHRYQDLEGREQPYLTDDEVRYLSIRKGSLDESERLEIESHVNHTYRFLMQIPWTDELRAIPSIAYGHHEKLDGAGYPRGIGADEIPIQTRMMTISDIFDALTASDRPYKRAVPAASALDIMAHEVKAGKLDPSLFEVFCEERLYTVLDEPSGGP